jgi:hypothetical protein
LVYLRLLRPAINNPSIRGIQNGNIDEHLSGAVERIAPVEPLRTGAERNDDETLNDPTEIRRFDTPISLTLTFSMHPTWRLT